MWFSSKVLVLILAVLQLSVAQDSSKGKKKVDKCASASQTGQSGCVNSVEGSTGQSCYFCTFSKGNYKKTTCEAEGYARNLIAAQPDDMSCVDENNEELKPTANTLKVANCFRIRDGKEECIAHTDINEKNGVCVYCTIPGKSMCVTAVGAERYLTHYKEKASCTNANGELGIPTPNPTPEPLEDGSSFTDACSSKDSSKDVCESHYTIINEIDQNCVFCEGQRKAKGSTVIRQTFCVALGNTGRITRMYQSSDAFKSFGCTGGAENDMNGDDDVGVPAPGPVSGPHNNNDDNVDDKQSTPPNSGGGTGNRKRPCPPQYYSKTGNMPCNRCPKGQKSAKASGSTKCVKASAGTDTDDDPKGNDGYVATCQQYNEDDGKCIKSYTRTNGKQDLCSYCTGSLMGQTRSYCLSAGTTEYYESQFKSRGGTISCTLNSGKDGDDSEPPLDDDGSASDDGGDDGKKTPCPAQYYSKTGNMPCNRCPKGQKSAKASGSTKCVKASAGTDTDDDPKGNDGYVATCQQYNEDDGKCIKSYTRTNGKQDLCSYCTGSLMGQTRSYCLSAGTTEYYESQFKSRGGTISCTLNSGKDGDDSEPPLDDDGSASDDDGDDGKKTPCPAQYYSKTGNMPCNRCPKGQKSAKASGSTKCVKASAGTDTDDDPKGNDGYVATCQQYNEDESKCMSSYTRTNGKQDLCSYCTGSLMGQTRSYCLSAGTTEYYESQFKSRGGTISCTLNSGKDGDDSEPPLDDDGGQGHSSNGGGKKYLCPKGWYSKTGSGPNCKRCPNRTTSTRTKGSKSCDIQLKCDTNMEWDEGTEMCVKCQAGKHTDDYPLEGNDRRCVPCDGNYYNSEEGEDCEPCDKGYGVNSAKTKCTKGAPRVPPKKVAGMNEIADCGVYKDSYTSCTSAYVLDKYDQEDMCSWCSFNKDNKGKQGTISKCIAVSKINDDLSLHGSNCTLDGYVSEHRFVPGVSPTQAPSNDDGSGESTLSTASDSAKKSDNTGLVVGMIFLSLFVVGMCIVAGYYKSQLDKKGIGGGESNIVDEDGNFAENGSSRRSSVMRDNPMHASGAPKPFLDSNYGTESDSASDLHFGHNPLAGQRSGPVPESISYKQSQEAAHHKRTSILSYAAGEDMSLDEVEAEATK
jgi:hypothetical protein